MTLTLDIKDSAIDKIIYFLNHLKDDVKIVDAVDSNMEAIDTSDSDYGFILEARTRRDDGEKCYTIDETLKELK
jgi:hypothetical protein